MENDEETLNWRFLNLMIDYEIQNLEVQYEVFYDDDFENLDPWFNNSEMSVQDVRNLISKFTTSTKFDYTEDIDKLFSFELDNEVSQCAKTSTGTSNRSSLSSSTIPDVDSVDSGLNFKTFEDDQIETSNSPSFLLTLPDARSEDPALHFKSIEDDQIEKSNPLSSSILQEDSYKKSEDGENEIPNSSSSFSLILDDVVGDPDFSFTLNAEVQVEYDLKQDIKDFELEWNIADLF